MRLYDSQGPNPLIVRWFATEKGIELERVPVDVIRGENREAAFEARNPMRQLPVLESDTGQVVTEVVAICEYLEELYPLPPLVGADPPERAETRMWMRRFDLGVLEPFMLGFRATVGRRFFEPRMKLLGEAAGGEVLALLANNLANFDRLLAGRTFVCGARFSLADIMLGSFLLFARRSGLPDQPGLAWVPDWLGRLEQRPAFAAA
jgi:glutathione S-transferase